VTLSAATNDDHSQPHTDGSEADVAARFFEAVDDKWRPSPPPLQSATGEAQGAGGTLDAAAVQLWDINNDSSMPEGYVAEEDLVGNEEAIKMIDWRSGTTAENDDEFASMVESHVKAAETLKTDEDRTALRDMLYEYRDVFTTGSLTTSGAAKFEYKITLRPDARPVTRTRNTPLHLRDMLAAEIDAMLKAGVIAKATTEDMCGWSSPIVLVLKKDQKSLRFCIDFRELNKYVVADGHRLPSVDDILGSFKGDKVFSSVDLASGYWQVPLAPECRKYTAFNALGTQFVFNVMPFGVSSAVSAFQRALHTALSKDDAAEPTSSTSALSATDITTTPTGTKNTASVRPSRGYVVASTTTGLRGASPTLAQLVRQYLDDVALGNTTNAEHFAVLRRLLQRLRLEGFSLKLSKCAFFRRSLKLLGHLISDKGIHTDPDKVKALLERPSPSSVQELQSALGCLDYYRRFVADFADIAAPLYKLLRKEVSFEWGADQQAAFDRLKRRLCDAPVVSFFDPEATMIVESDASGQGIGAVLSQARASPEEIAASIKLTRKYARPAKDTPIALHELLIQEGIASEGGVVEYASHRLSEGDLRKMTTVERELWAIIWAVRRWRHYLLGKRFVVVTDHRALEDGLHLNRPAARGRLLRWNIEMMSYGCTVIYRPGASAPVPDFLSRGNLVDASADTAMTSAAVTRGAARAAAEAAAAGAGTDAARARPPPPRTRGGTVLETIVEDDEGDEDDNDDAPIVIDIDDNDDAPIVIDIDDTDDDKGDAR
jgi:hypothetical protein